MAKEAEWERHARNGEWWRIKLNNLSPSEQESLRERLEEIVPKREFGDGLERYIDFIRPSEARTYEEYDAAQMSQHLNRYMDISDGNHGASAPLQGHITLAKRVLPDGYALHDLGWSQDRYDKERRSLLDAEMVDHDPENEVVLIERWFLHNPPMNKSHRKGILSQLKKVPSDRLREKAYAALEAAESGTGERKTDRRTQSPEKPDAHPEPSAGVTEAHLTTSYMTGVRRR